MGFCLFVDFSSLRFGSSSFYMLDATLGSREGKTGSKRGYVVKEAQGEKISARKMVQKLYRKLEYFSLFLPSLKLFPFF